MKTNDKNPNNLQYKINGQIVSIRQSYSKEVDLLSSVDWKPTGEKGSQLMEFRSDYRVKKEITDEMKIALETSFSLQSPWLVMKDLLQKWLVVSLREEKKQAQDLTTALFS